MTDSGASAPAGTPSWAAPGSSPAGRPRATVFGAAGAALAPPSGPSRGGAAPIEPAPRRTTLWTPPPKRGLVPLRPIPLGVVLSAPFRLQRRAPTTTLAPALVVSLVGTAAGSLATWGLVAGQQAALDSAYYADFAVAQNLFTVMSFLSWWAPLVVAFAANALLGGIVAVPASRSLLAERVSGHGLRRRLRGRVGRLVAWTAIVLVAGIGVFVLASVLPLLVAPTPFAGVALAFLIVFGELVAIVLGLGLVAARLGFTSHAITVEGLPVGAAIRRSWRLTHRSGWRLFGIQLLVWCLVGLAAFLLTLPVGWALDIVGGLLLPNGGEPWQYEAFGAARTVVLLVVTALTGAFGLVVQTVVGALLYLDARMRTEGLDLALARYVDERQRGLATDDPFPAGDGA